MMQWAYNDPLGGFDPTAPPSGWEPYGGFHLAGRVPPLISYRDSFGGEAESEGEAERKARFVWTPLMCARFEAAVLKLGVAHARPQAILMLMDCEGEEHAPSRENIKSRLQKYRQRLQKQQERCNRPSPTPSTPPPSSVPPAASLPASGEALATAACDPSRALERNQLNLRAQLDLHVQLTDRMAAQRAAQHGLAQLLHASRSQSLPRPVVQRLSQHVLVHRKLLHHLRSLRRLCEAEQRGDAETPHEPPQAARHEHTSPAPPLRPTPLPLGALPPAVSAVAPPQPHGAAQPLHGGLLHGALGVNGKVSGRGTCSGCAPVGAPIVYQRSSANHEGHALPAAASPAVWQMGRGDGEIRSNGVGMPVRSSGGCGGSGASKLGIPIGNGLGGIARGEIAQAIDLQHGSATGHSSALTRAVVDGFMGGGGRLQPGRPIASVSSVGRMAPEATQGGGLAGSGRCSVDLVGTGSVQRFPLEPRASLYHLTGHPSSEAWP
ncbi:hypothetical protein AB1Y20_007050 [Prymnesium parvum]|uniref:Uncharacterized protein n=1 Tax=Prymnesium parvum TaxID=97485 RepID=A0AB34IZA9_PRYPA|mmetsp:Transcript_24465/g.58921  ORF Transcript_24465/g.58921 Transcript_24465/m.58921 type:complete len:493 (+) Transcript_24465:44-1522(+)